MASSKWIKQIEKNAEQMKARYGVKSFKVQMNSVYPALVCTMSDDSVVMVQGIPNTTTTEAKFVAQNALKAARQAYSLKKATCAYFGGKA